MPSNLIENDLYQKVLLEPAQFDVNHLYIVSGYASSAMAFHHAENLKNINQNICVHLIIGMAGKDGLSFANHRAFQKLVNQDLLGKFECRYLIGRPAVHSKVYAWTNSFKSVIGFTGSANYSQQAFVGNKQREIITNCNPDDAYSYYQSLINDTIHCTSEHTNELISNYNRVFSSNKVIVEQSTKQLASLDNTQHIKCSLINRSGIVSQRSGLNWGQRPEENREPNQAYIPLKSEVYTTDFFPPIATHFTINADDGQILICTRAQQNGKAIHTPHNNSLIGEYFRNRLGVRLGGLVTMEHLLRYGRTDIDFYKIDDENYYMDFSQPKRS
jgi:NgoFVII restriction endonuclease